MLWALPDPATRNRGFARDPNHLARRLETDPAYAATYLRQIGASAEPSEADHQELEDEDDSDLEVDDEGDDESSQEDT